MKFLSKSKILIQEMDHVLRRVNPRSFDENGRICSRLFHDPEVRPSVHLERLANLNDILLRFSDTLFWVRINVEKIQKEDLGVVVYNPTTDSSHCLILNLIIETTFLSKNQVQTKKKEQARKLLKFVTEKVELQDGEKVVSPF